MPNITTRITAVALAVGLSLGGAAYATAASQSSTSPAVATGDARPHGGPGGRGHGGPGAGRLDTAALAESLGVTEANLKAALEKTRPAKGDRDDKRTEWAAAIAKTLGQSTADVQAVLDANRPAPPAAGTTPQQRPAKPDESALTKALAAKFGISQDKAQAALDAAHPNKGDHGDELAAALAKELGLDTAKVTSAHEAQRPSHP